MSRWLLEDKSDKLPPYASHQVGVSGVVYRDDTEEILVTQDKHKVEDTLCVCGASCV